MWAVSSQRFQTLFTVHVITRIVSTTKKKDDDKQHCGTNQGVRTEHMGAPASSILVRTTLRMTHGRIGWVKPSYRSAIQVQSTYFPGLRWPSHRAYDGIPPQSQSLHYELVHARPADMNPPETECRLMARAAG